MREKWGKFFGRGGNKKGDEAATRKRAQTEVDKAFTVEEMRVIARWYEQSCVTPPDSPEEKPGREKGAAFDHRGSIRSSNNQMNHTQSQESPKEKKNSSSAEEGEAAEKKFQDGRGGRRCVVVGKNASHADGIGRQNGGMGFGGF